MKHHLLTLFLALAASVAPLFAQSGTCGDNLTWNLDSEGLLTISGTGPMTNYSSTYDVPWYSYRESITTVIIEDGVTSIGNDAFYGCRSLTSITIPNGVTSIGGGAFSNCFSLTSVTIPNSVTSIGNSAFSGCSKLPSIIIPNSVTSFGESAFSFCRSLTSIVVENGNTKYDSRNNCNAIIETTTNTIIAGCQNTIIPNTVTSIGDAAFEGCSSLTSITIPNSVTGIASYAFRNCSSLTSVTIPNSVTSIGSWAFEDCSSLTSVTIPNSVTSIGDWAFYDCSSLTSITILNSVTSIGSSAFRNCTSLTSVTIPNSVTSIGDCAFYDCSSLTSITIPNSVTSIGNYAFDNCSSLPVIDNIRYADTYLVETVDKTLSTYNIKKGTRWIGGSAFEDCTSLTSITIPNSVTCIGNGAFEDCSSLTSVTIPNSVTSIGSNAFCYCYSLTSVTIPNSVTSIGSNAFCYCYSLTAVHISDIAAWCRIAFDGSTANPLSYAQNLYLNGTLVTDLVIPDGVTNIKSYAFYNCTSLTSVTIPNSVTSIGEYAFYECWNCGVAYSPARQKRKATAENDDNSPSTNYIRCEAITPPLLGNNVFGDRRYIYYDGWWSGSREPRTLYVPSQSVDAYKAADQWKDFNVQPIMDCGTIETTDGITVWEDQLPYTWEGISFTTAGTETKTLQASDGCDSIVTFTLRVLYRNITLQENESSDYYTQFAQDYNGQRVNTATLNRQFTQGKWATLCLPFNVNKAMMMSLGLYNRVFAFRYAQQLDDETIQVFFTPAQSIEAGKGYIVNPNAKLAAKTSFVFPNVTINTDSDNGDITALTGYNDGTNRGNLYLVGTLRTGMLQGSTSGNTYLGLKDNQLYYPNTTSGTSIRAYRGFFRSDVPVNASRVRIIADGETVSELQVVGTAPTDWSDKSDPSYTPARKYLRNGLLFIERNGITYTAQGHRID